MLAAAIAERGIGLQIGSRSLREVETLARMRTSQALVRLKDRLDRLAPLPGDRLPTERALADELGCSRQTVRVALAALEAEGEIWRHVGKGTFRGRAPRGSPVRETVLLQAVSPEQLMQARLMMEPAIAAEAARQAKAGDADYLFRLVTRGRESTSRGDAEDADARFHRGIAEIADNPILLGLLDYLSSARRRAAWQHQWDRTYRRVGVSEFTGLHSDQHRAVVVAIAEADAQAAFDAMSAHLATIAATMRRGAE